MPIQFFSSAPTLSIDRLKDSIPLGRGGKVEDVASAIAYLLSDDANYITGTFVDVAGGR